ncbi:MAG: hypothetical protein IPP77_06225 [Bacteroidetes bacterium]|nr:hypothetical protein [Bacteroidota bacterium]
MEILIKDSRTILDIQKEFNLEFPFLKLEFFNTPHSVAAPSAKSTIYSSERTLGTCRKVHNEGALYISPENTVAQVESELWEKFGLSTQIFRKSGRLWIETSLTDSWTLERQNREGLEMNEKQRNPYLDAAEDDRTDRDKWD